MSDQSHPKRKPKFTEMPERITFAEAQKRVDEFKHIKAVAGSGGGAAVGRSKKSYKKRKR